MRSGGVAAAGSIGKIWLARERELRYNLVVFSSEFGLFKADKSGAWGGCAVLSKPAVCFSR